MLSSPICSPKQKHFNVMGCQLTCALGVHMCVRIAINLPYNFQCGHCVDEVWQHHTEVYQNYPVARETKQELLTSNSEII